MSDAEEKKETTDESKEIPETETEFLSWTTHPVRRRPLVSALVTVFILVISMFVFYIMESKAFSVLALVVMFMSLAKFYMPTGYRLTNKKIMIKTTVQTLNRPWSMYRTYYPDKNGVLLSPFVRPSRLENFRGVYIMFSGNKEAVMKIVEEQIEKHQDVEQADTGDPHPETKDSNL